MAAAQGACVLLATASKKEQPLTCGMLDAEDMARAALFLLSSDAVQ